MKRMNEVLLFAIFAWGLSSMLGCSPVEAQSSTPGVIFSDYGPNMGISTATGWCVGGAGTPDCGPHVPRWVASPFIPQNTSTLTQIKLALGYASGSNGAVINLTNDGNGVPGSTILESWTPTNLSSSTTPLLSLKSVVQPILHAGTKYWLVAMGSASDSLDFWWDGATGTGSLESNNDGTSWYFLPGLLTAFEVLGGGTVTLVDPVPALLVGSRPTTPTLTTDPNVLGNQGTVIQGAAADGVAQAVVRISNLSQGQKIDVSILDENGNAAPTNGEDGTLSPITVGDTPDGKGGINAGAQSVGSQFMTFAAYIPPADFARVNNYQDLSIVSRTVTLQVQDSNQNVLASTPIQIVRPPVLYIHGLWSSESTWDDFDARVQELLPNLFTCGVDYSSLNHAGASVTASTLFVLPQVSSCLTDFKTEIKVAAAQFDFIAHSMGGLISNNMAANPGLSQMFRLQQTYGKGYIHKLITVDTPYYGSQFAAGLQNATPACKLIFNKMGTPIAGAVNDLVPGSPLLNSLVPLAASITKYAISGELNGTQSLEASAGTDLIVVAATLTQPLTLGECYSVFVTPLTAPPLFTFDNYFGGSGDVYGGANDLIVSKTSQLGPFPTAFSHSTIGVAHLNITIPYIQLNLFTGALDTASGNSNLAITLLNYSIASGPFLH